MSVIVPRLLTPLLSPILHTFTEHVLPIYQIVVMRGKMLYPFPN